MYMRTLFNHKNYKIHASYNKFYYIFKAIPSCSASVVHVLWKKIKERRKIPNIQGIHKLEGIQNKQPAL